MVRKRKPNWGAVLLHYALIGLAGTALIVVGSAFLRVRSTDQALRRAAQLSQADDMPQAYAELQRIAPIASLYPHYARQVNRMATHYCRSIGQKPDIHLTAEHYPATLWEAISAMPDPLVNSLLASRCDVQISALQPRRKPRVQPEQEAPSRRREVEAPARAVHTTQPAAKAATRPETPPSTEKPRWGITRNAKARVYDLSGKYLRTIPAGVVLRIDGIRKSSAGLMALCSGMQDTRLAAPVLLKAADLELDDRELDTVNAGELALRSERGKLVASLEEARKAPNPRNPFASEYATIKAKYLAYWKRVKDLQKKRDNSAESDHVAYADELRQLKGEDIRIGQAFEAAEKNYKDWNAAHPEAAASNPAIRALETDLAEIDTQIDAIAAKP